MDEPAWLRETRASYDLVATSYADLLEDALDESPADREQLAEFEVSSCVVRDPVASETSPQAYVRSESTGCGGGSG